MKGSLSPMKPWPGGQVSDYEGGGSPHGSPSSSPKTRKKPSRPGIHLPPSTDDESEGEIKKPSSMSNEFVFLMFCNVNSSNLKHNFAFCAHIDLVH